MKAHTLAESSRLFPVWEGHQSGVFHRLSVCSQVGLRSTARGWRGDGASTQACFIDHAQDGRKPTNLRLNNIWDGRGNEDLWSVEVESRSSSRLRRLPGTEASQSASAPPSQRLMVLNTALITQWSTASRFIWQGISDSFSASTTANSYKNCISLPEFLWLCCESRSSIHTGNKRPTSLLWCNHSLVYL